MMVLEGLAIQGQADLHTMDLEGQLIVAQAARVMQAPAAQHMTGLAGLLTVVLVVQCPGYPAALPMMAPVVRPIAALVAHATLALVGPAIQDRVAMVGVALRFADNGLC
jgi:hypothetical protein